MSPRVRRNKDEFQVPNKNRIKIQKREMKESLRQNRSNSCKLIQSPQNSDDEEYQEKLYNRGSEWWGKVNKRFFRELSHQEIIGLRAKTSSENLLALKYPARKLQNYFGETFLSTHPTFAQPGFVRVLLRREMKLQSYEHYELVTFSFKAFEDIKMNPPCKLDRNLQLSSFRFREKQKLFFDQNQLGQLQLQLIEVQSNQEVIKKLLQFEVKKQQVQDEINREIELWMKEQKELNQKNCRNWDLMRNRTNNQVEPVIGLEEEVEQIRKQLRMAEVLLYFKRGHGDKTQQMLQDAQQVATIKQMNMKQQQRKKKGTKIEQLKCLFETDCKICFCTESDAKNKVIYCNTCMTSFHQACYGVEQINLDQHFYCQVCLFIKKNSSYDKQNPKVIKKPVCQICCKLNFPMRQIDGHFYHITCLLLFDFVQIKDYKIQFKNNECFGDILQKIVNNQLQTQFCSFCIKDTGMKFKCSIAGCNQYFHPICAYLNGVYFDLKRSFRSLTPSLSCAGHYTERDSLNQIYLRRFFCDYKLTSNKTDVQFQVLYQKQADERALSSYNKQKDINLGVLKKGRIFKTYKCNQPKSKPTPVKQKNDVLNISKRQSEQGMSAPASLGNELSMFTETRKLMKKHPSSKNSQDS